MAAPTILLGSSTVRGVFTREVIEAMAASTPPPVIMPLCNPTSRMEAMPADVLAWSDGKALVATSSPSVPVEYNGTTYRIGQSNIALVFPGIGRGVIIAGARRVTKNVLSAAAKAVASKSDPTGPGAALLPGMENLGEIPRLSPQPSTTPQSRTPWPPRNTTTSCDPSSTPCGYPQTGEEI
jgi:malate dehydrogenase (oxaloacetate-decarboxylating)